MFVVAKVRDQLVARLFGGGFRAKKLCAHVVVDPNDRAPSLAKRRTVSEPINPAEPVTMIVRTNQCSTAILAVGQAGVSPTES